MMRRVAVWATAVLAVLVGAVGLSAVVLRWAPGSGAKAIEVHRIDEAHFNPGSGDPVFILIVGNDARSDEAARGDALHLVGFNPGQGQATILNIPRDTYVGGDKINSAHVAGPVAQARAVSALVGVDIPFVISTGFVGFQAMVDELGGVDVDVPIAMNDSFSGAFFDPGTVHMDGAAALAFARNRHIPGGDFRRSEHQAVIMIAGLRKLQAEHPSTTQTLKYLAVLARHSRIEGASLVDLYRLGRMILGTDVSKVRSVNMPGAAGQAGAASVVFVAPGADALFADFRDDGILQSH